MHNIYSEICHYYNENKDYEPVIPYAWVEGFFRSKAWQGHSDKELIEMWQHIQWFECYIYYRKVRSLDKLNVDDYRYAIKWLASKYTGFKKSYKFVKTFFSVLENFYAYLSLRRIVRVTSELREAIKSIVGEGRLNLKKPEPKGYIPLCVSRSCKDFEKIDDVSEFGEIVEKLMFLLSEYFQAPLFSLDFNRAMLLYSGPLGVECKDELEQDEFWLGFWDYFLFDYHLVRIDITPLYYYYHNEAMTHDSKDREAMEKLLCSRLVIFYISGFVTWGGVKCRNLFTNEIFYWPFPDVGLTNINKQLFYGHVLANNIIIVNYISTVEVSMRLRKRIKEEIIRQKEIYSVQQPNASWHAFFYRHALSIRHTINVFTNYNKVTVTPFYQLNRKYPIIKETILPDKKVLRLLETVMREYQFSVYDYQLAERLWHDFSQLSGCVVKKPEIWAATVIYVFSHLNEINKLSAATLAARLQVSSKSIYLKRSQIWQMLDLQKYDPRYLTEGGFMLSLFQV